MQSGFVWGGVWGYEWWGGVAAGYVCARAGWAPGMPAEGGRWAGIASQAWEEAGGMARGGLAGWGKETFHVHQIPDSFDWRPWEERGLPRQTRLLS